MMAWRKWMMRRWAQTCGSRVLTAVRRPGIERGQARQAGFCGRKLHAGRFPYLPEGASTPCHGLPPPVLPAALQYAAAQQRLLQSWQKFSATLAAGASIEAGNAAAAAGQGQQQQEQQADGKGKQPAEALAGFLLQQGSGRQQQQQQQQEGSELADGRAALMLRASFALGFPNAAQAKAVSARAGCAAGQGMQLASAKQSACTQQHRQRRCLPGLIPCSPAVHPGPSPLPSPPSAGTSTMA